MREIAFMTTWLSGAYLIYNGVDLISHVRLSVQADPSKGFTTTNTLAGIFADIYQTFTAPKPVTDFLASLNLLFGFTKSKITEQPAKDPELPLVDVPRLLLSLVLSYKLVTLELESLFKIL